MSSIVQIQIRRDTAANWTSVNPVLLSAEPGYETDTGKLKFGDGVTAWTGLPYFAGQSEITRNAGESIVAGRAVIQSGGNLWHFQPSTPAHYGRIIGISKQSATVGNPVIVVLSGIVNGLSGLTADTLVYSGNNGVLSDTPNTSGINQIVGIALSATEILIEQKQPINKI
jgi:hypothetical protein